MTMKTATIQQAVVSKDEVVLGKEDIPRFYYNIVPDLPAPLPPPKGDLSIMPKIFPKAILEQEMSMERFIPIPEELRVLYSRMGRPTPLYRARRLEKFLGTPARIYFKREDLSPSGSHKINTALAQAYYISREGYKEVTTETGAGQWGTALSLAGLYFGLHVKVFMVRCSYDQKPYRKYIIRMNKGEVVSSPSKETAVGRAVLARDPSCPGSLGIAISEAIEVAAGDKGTVYALGSVLNHVLLHQTIIGQEAKRQFELIGETPDILIGCVGGGSNFAGFTYPFLGDMLRGKGKVEAIGVEPKEVPTLTKAPYIYDYCDEAEKTPLLKMHSLGHNFMPQAIYSGGLRYHGVAPSISLLKEHGFIKSEAYSQDECFEAARIFSENEGIIPAPETSHAIRSVIVHALDAKKKGEERVIAFNFSGHGLLDMEAYANVLGLK